MVNREHKDRLFSFMFGRKENKPWILSLYNAINGTDYTDSDALEITTINDSVYMSMKNDVSFLLDSIMNFWEQQSTFNPNMPLRELMYAGRIYDKYVKTHRLNIYGRNVVEIPIPKLVVFYNGSEDKPDDMVLELKDSFIRTDMNVDPDIAVRVRMLNINLGSNKALLEACRPLFEYSWVIQQIRDNVSSGLEVEESVDKTIDEIPDGFEIKDFLIGNKAEVRSMCITEYNEAETMQMFKEEGREEGLKEGREEGREEGSVLTLIKMVCRKLLKNKSVAEIAEDLDEEEAGIRKIYNAAKPFAPDYNAEKIFEAMQSANA